MTMLSKPAADLMVERAVAKERARCLAICGDLEDRWRKSAQLCGDRSALSLNAAANGILAIRQIIERGCEMPS
jgi:hypothetical protein